MRIKFLLLDYRLLFVVKIKLIFKKLVQILVVERREMSIQMMNGKQMAVYLKVSASD